MHSIALELLYYSLLSIGVGLLKKKKTFNQHTLIFIIRHLLDVDVALREWNLNVIALQGVVNNLFYLVNKVYFLLNKYPESDDKIY